MFNEHHYEVFKSYKNLKLGTESKVLTLLFKRRDCNQFSNGMCLHVVNRSENKCSKRGNFELDDSIAVNTRLCSETFAQPRDAYREIWREVGTKMVVVSYERVRPFLAGKVLPNRAEKVPHFYFSLGHSQRKAVR